MHLSEAIDSVMNQTHTEWELILVDDGSSDRTADIMIAYSQRDERIKLASKGIRLGKAAAFNYAFRQATGQFVVLFAGDDTLPANSLTHRLQPFSIDPEIEQAVGFYKLRTFSEDRRLDGRVLPRGKAVSRSGGSIMMSRKLADIIFPIDEALPSEDIWLRHSAEDIADLVVTSQSIVLNYRIHDNNSNPRNRPFQQMSESIHSRAMAYSRLLECDRLPLSGTKRSELRRRSELENLRYAGRLLAVMSYRGVPLVDRLSTAAISSKTLYAIRSRFYMMLSGLRGA
ncbi:glycosyltransferase family 2 protein [Dietzia natronolimnaea]|nr:glycosyltransferase family 2 protein [Dietzia natronolimnaea]